jgi:hypothetical protein
MVHYSSSKRRAIMSSRKRKRDAIKAQGAARSCCEPSFKFQSPRKPFLLSLEEGHNQEFKNCSCYSSSSLVQKSLLLDFSKRFLLVEENTTKKSSTGTGIKSRNIVRVETTKIGTSISTTDDFLSKINWIEEDDTSARGMDLFNVKRNMGSGVLSQKQKVVAGQFGDELNLLHLSGAASSDFVGRWKVVNHHPTAFARSKSLRVNLSFLADEQLASTFFAF